MFVGDVIVVLRHFIVGRRIHAYDVRNNGSLLYTIDLDSKCYGLSREAGKLPAPRGS
jgi:hypothetical protein